MVQVREKKQSKEKKRRKQKENMKSDNKGKSEIAQVLSKVVSEYQKNKSKKLMMVDSLIAFAFFSAIVQAVYMSLVGTFPFNSFLSGFFCHIGLFALAVSLRLQLSSAQEFKNVSTERAAGDFIFCGVVFFFIVFSFLG